MSRTPDTTSAARPSTIGRHAPVALVACVGVALSAALSVVTRGWEQHRTRIEFEHAAESRVAALEAEIVHNLDELGAISGLYAASREVERHEFRAFVAPFLKQHSCIQALAWVPRVPDARRAEYEQAARSEGFSGFQFTERLAQGRMVPAPRRPEYFPVYYVEPYQGNELALGFDVASDPVRREALHRSADTGRVVATARITLVQETQDQFGLLVFAPIYRKGARLESAADRRRNLEGFALGAFRIGDMLRAALEHIEPQGVDLYLFDDSAPTSERFLALHHSRLRERAPQTLTPEQAYGWKGLHHAATINVAGRKWRVQSFPTPHYFAARPVWQSWAALVSGLLLTGVICAYLSLLITGAATARQSAANLLQAKRLLENEVTERKQAERRLRASETRLRTLLETLPQRIFYKDVNSVYLYANGNYARDLGIAPEQVVGRTDLDFYPEELARKYRDDDQRVMASGQTAQIEETYLRDGEHLIVHTAKTPVTDEQGRTVGILGIFWDITEEKRARQQVLFHNALLQTQNETSIDGILVVDAAGKMVSFNRRFVEMWGIPEEVVASRSDDRALQSAVEKVADPEGFLARIRYLYDHPDEESRDEIELRDGRVFDRYSAPVVGPDGTHYGRIWNFRDTTERQRMERALEAKNRELEAFVYTVSHDLRAPLISMEGFARLLGDEYADRLDDTARDYLGRIHANVERMSALLLDLLELSRVGRQEQPRELVPAGEVVAEVLDSLTPLIEGAGARVEVAPDLPAVHCARARLFQVFSNLVSNALKFAAPDRTPHIEIGWRPVEGGWRFHVTDDGIGIAPAHHRKVFEIFSRVGDQRRDGTGVGLAIVKRVVEDHGGEVGVESAPGIGSTFWFTFPAAAPVMEHVT